MRVEYDFHKFFDDVKLVTNYFRLLDMGLTPSSYAGSFWAHQIEELFEVCVHDRRFHIVTCFKNGIYVNRYEATGGLFNLAEGDRDPKYMLDSRLDAIWFLSGYD